MTNIFDIILADIWPRILAFRDFNFIFWEVLILLYFVDCKISYDSVHKLRLVFYSTEQKEA